MNIINCVGILFDDRIAQAAMKAYNDEKTWSAGGDPNKTQSRAYLEMIGFHGSIKGWIVRTEERSFDDAALGKPWPVRS